MRRILLLTVMAAVFALRAAAQLPSSLASADVWGYYDGDSFSRLEPFGFDQATTYSVCYRVAGDGVLKGSRILGVNLPFRSTANLADVRVWVATGLTSAPVLTQSVPVESLTGGTWTAVTLDEPYAIPAGGVYVGVDFTITALGGSEDKKPVLYDWYSSGTESLMIKYGSNDWKDYTNSCGAFAMQLFLTDMNLPEASVRPESLPYLGAEPGGVCVMPVTVTVNNKTDVTSIDYTLTVGDTETQGHLDLDEPLSKGYKRTDVINIEFPAPDDYKSFSVTFNIDKVNGIANTSRNLVWTWGKTVLRVVPRYTVVEEYTGTGCSNCPRGWLGMEIMKETRDRFIGVAFHHYNASDPMYVPGYCSRSSIGISGAPGCSIDRKAQGSDPYYSLETFDTYNRIVPEVDVYVTGHYNADSTEVELKADVDFLYPAETEGDYSIVYVLTADSLTGSDESWRQYNKYAGEAPAGDPQLDRFRRGGEFGYTYTTLIYNDVMIGSSYSMGGVNQAGSLGAGALGSSTSGSYTIPLPTSSAELVKALSLDRIYAVAIVLNPDGTVANASRTKVPVKGAPEPERPSAITDAPAAASAPVETARYNAAGQLITAPQRGLNIIRRSDGTTVKVMVK